MRKQAKDRLGLQQSLEANGPTGQHGAQRRVGVVTAIVLDIQSTSIPPCSSNFTACCDDTYTSPTPQNILEVGTF